MPTIHLAMRPVVPAVLLAALLSACESHLAGSLVYMPPYGIDRLECEELAKRIAAASAAAKAKQQLIDRASGSTAGPVIGTVVYGPEHGKARWEQRLYQEEADRKNCDRPPMSLLPPPPPSTMSTDTPLPRLGGR